MDARARAIGELPEDAPHDPGLLLVDPALAPDRLTGGVERLHHVVAVAEAAARLAGLHPAPLAAVRLGRQVLQEQRVHRPLEPHMELVDLALRQGEDADAREAEMLVEHRDVRLVATHPVERLGEHNVELSVPRVLEQRPGHRGGGLTLEPETAPSLYAPAIFQPSRLARSRQMRNWSSIEAARCWSEE